MLGRLGLTVDQALDEYGKIGKEVFEDRKSKGRDGTFKATALEKSIKSVVRRYGNATSDASEDLKLADDGPCKV